MNAIETIYNGYRFRSRLEVRWAVFFDTLHIPYEYEKQGFDLNGVWYLPDFWLPSVKLWFEVKGDNLSEEDDRKIKNLYARSNPVLLSIGQIGQSSLSCYGHDYGASTAGPCCWEDCEWVYCNNHKQWTIDCHLPFNRTFFGDTCHEEASLCCCHPRRNVREMKLWLPVAFTMARSARFEHGECPVAEWDIIQCSMCTAGLETNVKVDLDTLLHCGWRHGARPENGDIYCPDCGATVYEEKPFRGFSGQRQKQLCRDRSREKAI